MTPEPQPPVMADVAARAGVSLMTVSRVLNRFAGVRPETRERVEAAVAELGYRANAAARTLAGGRSRRLGVISIETPYFGPSSTLFGIEAAARAEGHVVSFAALRSVDDREMQASLDHLNDAHVDGTIVIAPSRAALNALPSQGTAMPLVVISGDEIDGHFSVAVDQAHGARLATSHLLDQGHEQVQHVRGPRGWIDADAREAAWRAELHRRRVKAPRPYVGDWTPRSGYEIGRRLAADLEVDAVFVANDQMAIGVLRALSEGGRPVPEDVRVVGFDDIPEAEFLLPPLTSVRLDFSAVGRAAVDLLLHLVDGDECDRHVVVPTELVVRQSSIRDDDRSE